MSGLTAICYIDESGSPTSKEDIFIVSGVWILVEKNTSYLEPFREAIENVVNKLNQKNYKVKELHTTTMHRELDWITSIIKRWLRHSSYLYSIYPYDMPMIVASGSVKPAIFASSISERFGISFPDRMEITRKSVLSSSVSLSEVISESNKVNHFKFILDSEIWEKSRSVIENIFEKGDNIKVDVHLKDSKEVPGLQMADMMANITRLKLLGNNGKYFDNFREYIVP